MLLFARGAQPALTVEVGGRRRWQDRSEEERLGGAQVPGLRLEVVGSSGTNAIAARRKLDDVEVELEQLLLLEVLLEQDRQGRLLELPRQVFFRERYRFLASCMLMVLAPRVKWPAFVLSRIADSSDRALLRPPSNDGSCAPLAAAELALERGIAPVLVADTFEPLRARGRTVDLCAREGETGGMAIVAPPLALGDTGNALLGGGAHRLDDGCPCRRLGGGLNARKADEVGHLRRHESRLVAV